MPSTHRPLLQRSGAGQHLGLDQRRVFVGSGEAKCLGIDQQVQGTLEGHDGFVSSLKRKFDLDGGRHQSRPPLSTDKVIAGLSAEPLRTLQATRDAVGAHLLAAFGRLGGDRRELALQLTTDVFAELGAVRRAVRDHAKKLLNCFTNAAVCGVGDCVFHDRHFTHWGL